MEKIKNGFLNKKRNRSEFSKSPRGTKNSENFKRNENNKENDNINDKLDTFNKGEFKKKYDKNYVLGKLKKTGNSKDRLNIRKNFSNKKYTASINHNDLNLTLTENLFNKAKKIYEAKVKLYLNIINI